MEIVDKNDSLEEISEMREWQDEWAREWQDEWRHRWKWMLEEMHEWEALRIRDYQDILEWERKLSILPDGDKNRILLCMQEWIFRQKQPSEHILIWIDERRLLEEYIEGQVSNGGWLSKWELLSQFECREEWNNLCERERNLLWSRLQEWKWLKDWEWRLDREQEGIGASDYSQKLYEKWLQGQMREWENARMRERMREWENARMRSWGREGDLEWEERWGQKEALALLESWKLELLMDRSWKIEQLQEQWRQARESELMFECEREDESKRRQESQIMRKWMRELAKEQVLQWEGEFEKEHGPILGRLQAEKLQGLANQELI